MRKWFDPGYWRWKGRGARKGILYFLGLAALLSLGVVAAYALADDEYVTVATTQRLVTIVHKVPGGTSTEVVTETGTITDIQTGPTQLVTVTRNGKQVTIRVPAETITHSSTVTGPVITKTKTDTETETEHSTETQTVDRPTTVTQTDTVTHQETGDPGRITITETETTEGPTKTVTDTETVTRTETDTVTHTDTETETVTVTETETSSNP